MRRMFRSRAELILFVVMITIMLIALTASVTLAAMQAHEYGENTVYIADVGEVSCTASVSAKVYPGGTSNATVHFSLAQDEHDVSKVSLSNFTLTSFTLKWAGTESATFNTTSSSVNSSTVTTTAGDWVFAMNFGSDTTLTHNAVKSATLSITAPFGADAGGKVGGSPKNGYLVQSIESIVCNFTVNVDPVEY